VKDVKKFKKYGYAGIFIITFLGSVAIFSPAAPLATFFAGTLYNPLLIGCFAAVGSTFGDMFGYGIGYGSQVIITDSVWYERIKYFMKINGALTLFILATIPNPFFDLAGMAAGVTNFPFWQFLLISFIGKCIKFTCFALIGNMTKK